MVTDGNWTYHGNHFVICENIELLNCTPETNKILYVSYTSITKIVQFKIILFIFHMRFLKHNNSFIN